ncbi:hypothetical protein L484_013715 [Morus notabilis]|uniref:Uncharacterized protein n=1 Tax=Morus notabilis TaxID=981085 RepID=W9S1X1_9ROSA|nr:hypothetical protein L484_013715 [Morus notabilis]
MTLLHTATSAKTLQSSAPLPLLKLANNLAPWRQRTGTAPKNRHCGARNLSTKQNSPLAPLMLRFSP